MAVVSLDQVSAKVTTDVNGYDNYTVRLRATTNARTDGPATVKAYATMPGVGDTYSFSGETDTGAGYVSRDVDLEKEDDTLKLWKVIVVYSNDPGKASKRDPEETPTLPWNEPEVPQIISVKEKEAYLRDLDDRLIASSAGEPYDPVQERDDTKYILRITRNTLTTNPNLYSSYRDAMNSDTFYGWTPETVKVEKPGETDVLYFAGQKYYKETWEFAVKDAGWRNRLYDYGMYKLVGVAPNQKLEPIKSLSGTPLSAPRLLDGAGGVLAVGAAPVVINAPLGFRPYELRPFGLLGFSGVF